MSILVFADVMFPNTVLTAGVRGKNMRMNSRVKTDSGDESINIVWTKSLRQYEVGIVPLSINQWRDIEALHEITEGGAYGFLLEDPKDNAVDGGAITRISDGVFQLVKRYSHIASGRTKDRNITRPRAAGFVLTQSGVPLVLGTDYTLDVLTGLVSIAANPDPTTLAWSGRFLVPVHFMDDVIDWELVAAGASDSRFLAGPSVMLEEVRE